MEFQIGSVFIKAELPHFGEQLYIKVVLPLGSHMLAFRTMVERSNEEIEMVGLIYKRGDEQAVKTVQDW